MTRMIKKRLLKAAASIALCIAVMVCALSFSASAGAGSFVTVKSAQGLFEPFSRSVSQGDSFNLAIKLKSDKKIIDGTLVLRFDSSRLRVTGCSGGSGIDCLSNITYDRQQSDNSVITTFSAGGGFYDFTEDSTLMTYTFRVTADFEQNEEITVDVVNLIANNTYINDKGVEDISVDGDVKLISKSEVRAEDFTVNAIFPQPKGDVNLDGKVDIDDVTELQLGLLGKKTMSEIQLSAAQVYYDDKISIRDATIIQMFLAGLIQFL